MHQVFIVQQVSVAIIDWCTMNALPNQLRPIKTLITRVDEFGMCKDWRCIPQTNQRSEVLV